MRKEPESTDCRRLKARPGFDLRMRPKSNQAQSTKTQAETATNNASSILTLWLPVSAPINSKIGAPAIGIPACSRTIVTASTTRGWLVKK